MKKLMTLMLGLTFLTGTVSLFAAQDKPAESTSKKKMKKKKKKASKTEEKK
jgi:hypothetical protein